MRSKNSFIKVNGEKFYYTKGILKIPDEEKEESIKIDSLCQIHGLEKVKGVKRVDLSHNNLTTLECWEKLNGFEEVDLSFNQISDISPLIKLKNMKILFINGNRIDFNQIYQFKEKRPDVKFFINHVVIKEEKCYYKSNICRFVKDKDIPGINIGRIDSIDDVKGLGNYDNLYGLEIWELLSPRGLERLTNLKALLIFNAHFNEIIELGRLKDLDVLVFIEPYEICDLSPLNNLSNPQYLILGGYPDICGTLIEKIEGFENMKRLKFLMMAFCCLKEIKGLENLENLEFLDISENNISKIEGLENLKNLKDLEIEFNEISTIQGLENLHDLTQLNLSHNQISTIEGLESLRNLKIIYLYENILSDKYAKKREIIPFLHPAVDIEKLKLE